MLQPLKDPFYNQIIAALSGYLDPAVFERCMGDLLRPDFPGLVPVPGGSDSGFDGLVPDQEGTFPLICTTARDVERNLRGSLAAIRKRGWPGRNVALATSQALAPQRLLALFETAKAKGFQMRQVFGQEALADRLYRNGRWCKELLQLSWKPSPLGVVPATRRPLINLEPIGREDALAWLRSACTDCVIAGEPGSGKTFLLYHLIRQGWPGLFLTSSDFEEERIILAYNEQRPEWIIVDDAHAFDHLEKLLLLRGRLGADFKVVATTWKGSRDEVLQMLGATERQSLQLELLTRDEIVQVFRGMGIQAEDDVLRVMVNQAANKPGLAVTLGTLWLRGEWSEVLDGKALRRELLAFFDKVLQRDAAAVLTTFSLGGDSGMPQGKVREFLDLPRSSVWSVVTGLSFGGVLSETAGGVYAVWPRELRFALLQQAFSPESAIRHDLLNLLDQAPSRASAVETLIAAQVDLPPGKLRELVRNAGTTTAWEMLAESSEADARWVLESYPGHPLSIARATLEEAPEPTIHLLLDTAVSATGQTHSQPDHPMRILEDWVSELRISTLKRVRRRQQVARATTRFLRSGGKRTVGLHGILLALKPGLESDSLDPGLGNRVTFFSTTVSLEEVAEVRKIWETYRDAIASLEASDWPIVSSILWGWAYPDYAARGARLTRRVEREMRSFAGQLLRDLTPLAARSPGLSAALLDVAEEIGASLKLQRDPIFELLYPPPDAYEESSKGESLESMLKEIATSWVSEGPAWTAERFTFYEGEIRGTGRPCWPRRAPELCRVIADLVKEPEPWLAVLLRRDLPYDLVQPFLEKFVSDERNGWEETASRLLDEDRHAVFVAGLLQRRDLPGALVNKILDKANLSPYLIETLCQKGRVPQPMLMALLNNPDQDAALAAAVGAWLAEPRGEISAELQADWKAAILRARVEDDAGRERIASSSYWLEEILRHDRALAFEWVRSRLRDNRRPRRIREKSLFAKVITFLDRRQRIALLAELAEGNIPIGLVNLLVAGDLETYQRVLAVENLGGRRLEPLAKFPDTQWADLAVAALEAGFEESLIASTALHGIRSWAGSGLSTFQQWDQAFAAFENDPREGIPGIARHGRREAQRRIQRAEAEERREALQGI